MSALPRMIGKFRIGFGWRREWGREALWNAAAVSVLFAHIAFLVLVVHPTSAPRVLHYTTVFGIDLIGSGVRLFLLPGVGFGVLVVNLLVSIILRRDPAGRLVPAGTLLVEAALLTATLAIVRQGA